ncbi:MAG: DUF2793 domain-containing protein [Pseudomonadota bacterium]
MSSSHRLSLPYLAEAQAQKHVTVNDALRRLDALVHLRVLSASTQAEPGNPTEGDAYILPNGATGTSWEIMSEGDIAAFQDGAWMVYAPAAGVTAYTEDQGIDQIYDGSVWQPKDQSPQMGVNTSPDATNKLSVKSDAILFSHDDVTPGNGDVRITVNKQSAAGTASFLFQTAFAGKAEFGLTGTDDFVIKVADDQGTFRDALVIDRQTGAVSFPNTP